MIYSVQLVFSCGHIFLAIFSTNDAAANSHYAVMSFPIKRPVQGPCLHYGGDLVICGLGIVEFIFFGNIAFHFYSLNI